MVVVARGCALLLRYTPAEELLEEEEGEEDGKAKGTGPEGAPLPDDIEEDVV